MTAFTMMSIILTLSIAFGYLNYRFLKVQPAIATTMSALVLSIVLLILGHFGVHYIESTFREMMSKIDFYNLLINGMLGFLLFAGALNIDFNEMKEKEAQGCESNRFH